MRQKHLWAIIAALGTIIIVLGGLLVFRAGRDSAQREVPAAQKPVPARTPPVSRAEPESAVQPPPKEVPVSPSSAPADYGYPFDLPQKEPVLYAKWERAVQGLDTRRYPWLRGLDGVAAPIRAVSLGGRRYHSGSVCEPHNCGANNVTFLFPADESRIVGRFKITDDVTFREAISSVGQPSPAEQACLERLAGNYELSVC